MSTRRSAPARTAAESVVIAVHVAAYAEEKTVCATVRATSSAATAYTGRPRATWRAGYPGSRPGATAAGRDHATATAPNAASAMRAPDMRRTAGAMATMGSKPAPRAFGSCQTTNADASSTITTSAAVVARAPARRGATRFASSERHREDGGQQKHRRQRPRPLHQHAPAAGHRRRPRSRVPAAARMRRRRQRQPGLPRHPPSRPAPARTRAPAAPRTRARAPPRRAGRAARSRSRRGSRPAARVPRRPTGARQRRARPGPTRPPR